MAQRLGRVAGALGMGDKLAHVARRGVTDHRQSDRDLFEIRWGVVNVIFLGVSERRTNVCGRVFDGDLVEWREPRQLRQQSKRRPHQQVLERRGPLFGPTARHWLIGLDDEFPHPSLEVDVIDDPCHRSCRGPPLLRRFGAHLFPEADDLSHLFLEIDPTPDWL